MKTAMQELIEDLQSELGTHRLNNDEAYMLK